MPWRKGRLAIYGGYILKDVVELSLNQFLFHRHNSIGSLIAHVGGFLNGLLLGLILVKNLEVRVFKVNLWLINTFLGCPLWSCHSNHLYHLLLYCNDLINWVKYCIGNCKRTIFITRIKLHIKYRNKKTRKLNKQILRLTIPIFKTRKFFEKRGNLFQALVLFIFRPHAQLR